MLPGVAVHRSCSAPSEGCIDYSVIRLLFALLFQYRAPFLRLNAGNIIAKWGLGEHFIKTDFMPVQPVSSLMQGLFDGKLVFHELLLPGRYPI